MGIVELARAFVERVRGVTRLLAWDWRRCPYCGHGHTIRNGGYDRHPYRLSGREKVRVQRHWCHDCERSYSEKQGWLQARRWYAREVVRFSLDLNCHCGNSLRRSAELVRSLVGRQERYHLWQGQASESPAEECHLAASTIGRWLDKAGAEAKRTLAGQLRGVTIEAVAADGLWARLRGGSKRVVLLMVDAVSGLVFPPVVVKGEGSERAWHSLFQRAEQAGLDLGGLRGVTSDWTNGLVSYLRRSLPIPQHQRCLWHFWRSSLGRLLAALEQSAREAVTPLLQSLMQASTYEAAEQALAVLAAHPAGGTLAKEINTQFDHLFIRLLGYYRQMASIAPEWCWRDYRLRLSRGRNHGTEQRLEHAALVWAIYHNFEPTQRRSERQRHYRHPGQSPLEVAGLSPGNLSYLDALAI